MQKNNSLKYLLINDAEKYLHVENACIIKAFFKRAMFRYIFWLRLCHHLKQNKWAKYLLAPLPVFMLNHLSYKYGIFVDSNIEIGPGLKIIHGGCLYLNAKKIGNNFTVYQGVTLGATPGKGVPTVGNNVTVFAGAKVLGEIQLNDECMIAANAVVTKDVPEGAIMMGIPAKQYIKNRL